MPPKGRKKAMAAAKSDSNGIEKEVLSVQDKMEVIKSGKGRMKARLAESEDLAAESVLDAKKEQGLELDDDDIIDEKQIETPRGESTSDAMDDHMPASKADVKPWDEDTVGSAEGDVDGTVVMPRMQFAGKLGRKKAGNQKSEQVAMKANGDVLPDAVDEAKAEPEKVSGKRGRKKVEVSDDEVATTEAEEGKQGRNKAGGSEDIEDEVAIMGDKDELEKIPGKRGRKKAGGSEDIEGEVAIIEDKDEPEKVPVKRIRKKAGVAEDEVAATEAEEKPVPGKRGRKKAAMAEEIEDEVAKEEPAKTLSRRGRKKAAVAVEDIETAESKDETEKVSGRRNRKKSEDVTSAKQDEAMETEEEHAPPMKRSQNTKSGSARKDNIADKVEEDEDFAPRRTRGGRNVKQAPKEVAPVAKGRKRKAKDEKVEVKQVKKGKKAEEQLSDAQIDENRQLAVSIERNRKLDEMARNSSLEEEKETKATSTKGSAKSGGSRKRANQDVEESKPEKVQKEEPSKAKGGSKKQQIPDVSALDFENTSKTPNGEPWNFKIVSWNVNGVRAWLEKNGLSYLHHEKPDVLCVQETKCSDDKLPKELEVEGYHCHWLAGDKDGYSGVGVLSKQKPLSITDGIGIEEHDNEGRAITVEYEKFYLVTTYVPNSGRGLVRLDYRKKWDEDFRAYLKTLDEKKAVVLCGDLNVAHEEIDIASPKSNKKSAGFTQEERDGFSALLEEGFVDTFRHLYPEAKAAYTFWTYMMNSRAKNVGWRMDYFVISERFKDHLCDSLIRKEVMGSDHCPVGLLLHV